MLDSRAAKLTEHREGDPDVSPAPTRVAEPTAAPAPARPDPSPFALGAIALAVVAVAAIGRWAMRRAGGAPDGAGSVNMRIPTQTTRGDVTDPVLSADGRSPVKVATFDPEMVFELAWLRDHRSLAISAGTRSSDAVLVRSFR